MMILKSLPHQRLTRFAGSSRMHMNEFSEVSKCEKMLVELDTLEKVRIQPMWGKSTVGVFLPATVALSRNTKRRREKCPRERCLE